MPQDQDPEVLKAAFKEAMKEWLDEKYAMVGRWSVRIIVTAGLGALMYWVLHMSGWHK